MKGRPENGEERNYKKKNIVKKQFMVLVLGVAAAAILAGCGKPEGNGGDNSSNPTSIAISPEQDNGTDSTMADAVKDGAVPVGTASLEVRFGDNGEPFVMKLEDNKTAAAIAKYVGTADWRLPIYHYDDYEGWEVMQYYDIPGRYEISGNAETVASEKAGEVYYSEPNRIILFYQDGEITGEYTKIGTIENTEEFREAVENNPVLEGWGNKIVLINSME